MIMRFLILLTAVLLAVLPAAAPADELLMPPSVWETCSPSGKYCARLDPADNSILAYGTVAEKLVLWRERLVAGRGAGRRRRAPCAGI